MGNRAGRVQWVRIPPFESGNLCKQPPETPSLLTRPLYILYIKKQLRDSIWFCLVISRSHTSHNHAPFGCSLCDEMRARWITINIQPGYLLPSITLASSSSWRSSSMSTPHCSLTFSGHSFSHFTLWSETSIDGRCNFSCLPFPCVYVDIWN